jgi:hypothetical protein
VLGARKPRHEVTDLREVRLAGPSGQRLARQPAVIPANGRVNVDLVAPFGLRHRASPCCWKRICRARTRSRHTLEEAHGRWASSKHVAVATVLVRGPGFAAGAGEQARERVPSSRQLKTGTWTNGQYVCHQLGAELCRREPLTHCAAPPIRREGEHDDEPVPARQHCRGRSARVWPWRRRNGINASGVSHTHASGGPKGARCIADEHHTTHSKPLKGGSACMDQRWLP